MAKFVDIAALEAFSLVELLARLGHHPVRKSGKEHFYHSMLRETGKNTPSFTVWDAGGKWTDRGGANASGISGGGIVQFGLAYWQGIGFNEVLEKIEAICGMDHTHIAGYQPPQRYSEDPIAQSHRFQLVAVRSTGNNDVLTAYLKSRGVYALAGKWLKEIYYRDITKPPETKNAFALGWQNQHGNWEFVNARGFKSSTGTKGISLIKGKGDHYALFEGYMDFLSWLTDQRPANLPTIVVLNSVTQIDKALSIIPEHAELDIYFDHDPSGRECTRVATAVFPNASDRSYLYAGFNDYNDKLMAGRLEQSVFPST